MHLAIVGNLNERSLVGEQTSGRIIRRWCSADFFPRFLHQNIYVESKFVWNRFIILSRFVSYPVAFNLSSILEVRVDQPKQSLLTGPCRPGLSCILGVTKRDVFWGLPNMHPESYDCGLPGHLAVTRAAIMEPGVLAAMSDELILQISCNIFLAFKWILMMTSGQNISHFTTAKLSLNVWNHDLIWWQNKIDTQKHFHKTTITSSWTISKTKIPITIVKAQMPSNPNQKSRMRDNERHSRKFPSCSLRPIFYVFARNKCRREEIYTKYYKFLVDWHNWLL